MQVESYAKINWSLRVTGRRSDGFHDLETIFQSISLHDTLTFTPSDHLALTCDDPSIPVDEGNLVMRAARALGSPPVAIHLAKRIPAGGGLGGGSSNAAATLVTLSQMFPAIAAGVGGATTSSREPAARLAEIGLSLGSDVPFFLVGGTAYATGRGEVLTPLPSNAGVPLLLLMPGERVMTKDAFAALRRFTPPLGLERASAMELADFTNDFEPSVFATLPWLAGLKGRLLNAGAQWAGMSGSGSTIAGSFREPATRDAAASTFRDVRAVACETK
jgi:4-diphosphocytidyl-2-C-methyl-D-erythritol kinase